MASSQSNLFLPWLLGRKKRDFLIEPKRKFHDWLTSKGIRHTYVETPGAHVWIVWRRNIATFASLLFQ